MSSGSKIYKSIKLLGLSNNNVIFKTFRIRNERLINNPNYRALPVHFLQPVGDRKYSTTSPIRVKNNSSNDILSSIASSLSNMRSRYSIRSKQQRFILASCLFESIKHQAYNSQWYIESPSDENYKIKPEFRPIHAMLSMHMWFVHRRLFAENKNLPDHDTKKHDNLLLQEELFELFWTDTTSRIRAQEGINEMTVNKHLKDVQRATFVHLTQYDHAFDTFANDGEKRFEIICDAIWKHVLGGEDDASDELIKKIGAYFEYQMGNIVLKLPDDYFNEGRIAWGNIPELTCGSSDVDGDSDSSSEGDDGKEKDRDEKRLSGPLRGMTFLRGNWVQVLTLAGEPYYWNMDTDQTSWDKP